MELNAMDGELPVLQSHDFAFGCFGGDLKT